MQSREKEKFVRASQCLFIVIIPKLKEPAINMNLLCHCELQKKRSVCEER